MYNFQLLADGFNVQSAIAELAAKADMFKLFTGRQDTPGSAHHDTECIILRGPATITMEAVFNDTQAHWYPLHEQLPEVAALTYKALDKLSPMSELGRIMVVNLTAGGSIDEHCDEGAYAAHYERFHLVLTSKPGNVFHCGRESIHMKPGELWQFDHHQLHSVENASDEDRIHIIIDARRQSGQEQ